MIKKETIDRIFESARIEEVIGEFVNLKRSGASYKGLSPFVDERTPSFMVSPSKQIFKDFSSGKGGSVVTFLMEHEQMSYPEALRFLAEKYNIEIEETEMTPQMEEARSRRESLYIVSEWAEKSFIRNLTENPEGQAIGGSYFKERGFSPEVIEDFKLGYAMDQFDAMVKDAKKEGHNMEYLQELGLVKDKGKGPYDGFKGRVIFPIHNLSGRPLGFGARTLKADKKIPKYLNSPECEIYHKSKIVYGIYQAKKHIVKEDVCYLVEGYTDVISMYQAGVRNVVASSGTALTSEQVRLIGRYTKNITILYDADPAGIKASFRGIDLILAEGLNVRAALLPEGEDPDSFSKARDLDEIKAYFDSNVKDFIVFKTEILTEETKGDPVKKAALVRNIVESIAKIPDSITRSVYTKECSATLDIPEKALLSELNKIRMKTHKDQVRKEAVQREQHYDEPPPEAMYPEYQQEVKKQNATFYQEKDILRLMLMYGLTEIELEDEDDEGKAVDVKVKLAHFVDDEMSVDELLFEDQVMQSVYTEYMNQLDADEERDPVKHLSNHEDKGMREMVVELVSEKYVLHKWDSQNIDVTLETDRIFRAVRDALYSFKARKINVLVEQKEESLKNPQMDPEVMIKLLEELKQLKETRRMLLDQLGITVFK